MKIVRVSSNIYKIEAWFMFKMSAWIVNNDDGVYIIDTGMGFMGKKIYEEAQKLGNVKCILLTHGHSDHTGGISRILANIDVPVYVHESDMKYMEGQEPFPGRKKIEKLVEPGLVNKLEMNTDNQLNSFGSLIPIHTPGHSPGHVVYYHKQDKVLIAGDLFTSKRGNLTPPMSMFTADMEEAIKSVNLIKHLDIDIISICHGSDVNNANKGIELYLERYH